MKKINAILPIIPVLILFSCTKVIESSERTNTPPFSATGVWRGPITSDLNPGVSALFINRPDGTSQLYFYDGQNDTSATGIKFTTGTYTVRNNVFFADYTSPEGQTIAHAETSATTFNSMRGAVLIAFSPSIQSSFAFEVFK